MNKFLHLNRIEFLVTSKCTSQCHHCHVLPGIPKGVLSLDKAKLAIDLATENHPIDSVMAFGGEPLLYPEITCSIFEYSTQKGIPTKELITNCFWTKDHTKIDEICYQLKKSSANKILLSIDYFHQEFLDFEIVRYTVEKLSKLVFENIYLHPCWYESPSAANQYDEKTRKYLAQLSEFRIPTGAGNTLFPSGKAALNYKDKFRPIKSFDQIYCGSEPYSGRPDTIDTLTIDPDATVSVCGQDKMEIEDFINHYNPYKDEIMKTFLNNGVHELVKLAEKSNIKFELSDYYSPCEACIAFRKVIKE